MAAGECVLIPVIFGAEVANLTGVRRESFLCLVVALVAKVAAPAASAVGDAGCGVIKRVSL
jgi:hypothetical protein